ncbi:MAG TPA: sigma-70 family RNA polymerase sigma factor [Jiangellales bacterium]|nr:sigma-70 family RNA polymerase sigma factor [Jiangellales bacterium]
MNTDARVERLLRELSPRVLGALIRRFGDFADCEDAIQEALLEAAVTWSSRGVPDRPLGWLLTVASRRLVDHWRREHARRHREARAAALAPGEVDGPNNPADIHPDRDDTLTLLFLCCHPALTPPAQIALTLRAVGGLSTAQIAAAFLVPEVTMSQRIRRAKQQIRSSGIPFRMPEPDEREERLRAVLHVLYLIFNEGYAASSGADLQRGELTGEAIRLGREVHRLLPDHGEAIGLLALMLLTDARRAARTRPDGALVPLTEQDRRLWNAAYLAEGRALINHSLRTNPLGPYQVQAAIAAVHADASRAEDTDWPQILMLYRLLERLSPNPMVTLNHAVALAMVHGPAAGLDLLAGLDDDSRMSSHHRLDAVRAHLLELSGQRTAARAHYQKAARRTVSLAERRYLDDRAARLAP